VADEMNAPARRGRIDEYDLTTLDVASLAGGRAGNSKFVEAGFRQKASYFRDYVDRWGFGDLGDVADIGCGYGRWSFFLAETNRSVCGFDRDQDRLDLGSQLATAFDLDNLTFSKRDVTDLGNVDRQFDGVWCFNALQFVHRSKCLAEIHRILRPGGALFLGMYEGAGKVLEKFFTGYALGGTSHRITKFAMLSLAQGPAFGEGTPNYGDPTLMADILSAQGFELDATHPLDVQFSPKKTASVAQELSDLSALGKRLQTDEKFAQEFALHPEVAAALPMSLQLRARKI
jgi:SAM-dependent methyltransferase